MSHSEVATKCMLRHNLLWSFTIFSACTPALTARFDKCLGRTTLRGHQNPYESRDRIWARRAYDIRHAQQRRRDTDVKILRSWVRKGPLGKIVLAIWRAAGQRITHQHAYYNKSSAKTALRTTNTSSSALNEASSARVLRLPIRMPDRYLTPVACKSPRLRRSSSSRSGGPPSSGRPAWSQASTPRAHRSLRGHSQVGGILLSGRLCCHQACMETPGVGPRNLVDDRAFLHAFRKGLDPQGHGFAPCPRLPDSHVGPLAPQRHVRGKWILDVRYNYVHGGIRGRRRGA